MTLVAEFVAPGLEAEGQAVQAVLVREADRAVHLMGNLAERYAGIDVSLESASLCGVDVTGRIVREAKGGQRA